MVLLVCVAIYSIGVVGSIGYIARVYLRIDIDYNETVSYHQIYKVYEIN
jgi:hypothetical protein